MEELIHPSNSSLGNVFFDKASFSIPNYQRNYSWDKSKIQVFWEDIEYCISQRILGIPCAHFFGQIIKILNKTHTNGMEEFSLIDGQQRIITLTLLCTSMARKCCIIKRDSKKTRTKNRADLLYKKIYNKFIYYTVVKPDAIRLVVQENDKTYLHGLINSTITDLTCAAPNKDRQSQKLLSEAIVFFNGKLAKLPQDEPKILDFLDAAINTISEDCQLIELTVEKKIGIQHLFTTVNDRGLNLTTGELLKAKCIESLQNNILLQNECELLWDKILSNDAALAENFLDAYYGSKKRRKESKINLYHNYLNSIVPMCKSRNLGASEEISLIEEIRQIQSAVETIRIISMGIWPYPISDSSPCLWKRNRLNILVNGLKCKSVIPLLLSAKTFLRERSFYELLSICELNYFNTVSINSPNRYSKFTEIMFDEAVLIRESKTKYKRKNLSDAFATLKLREHYDINFETKLRDCTYKPSSSNPISRYFVYMMELYHNAFPTTGGYAAPDDALTLDYFALSVEHIYGQQMEQKDRSLELESIKNKIGNLCAIGKGTNSNLGNKKFAEKKCKYSSAGYKISMELSTLAEWNLTEYKKMTERYVELAKKLFVDNLGI